MNSSPLFFILFICFFSAFDCRGEDKDTLLRTVAIFNKHVIITQAINEYDSLLENIKLKVKVNNQGKYFIYKSKKIFFEVDSQYVYNKEELINTIKEKFKNINCYNDYTPQVTICFLIDENGLLITKGLMIDNSASCFSSVIFNLVKDFHLKTGPIFLNGNKVSFLIKFNLNLNEIIDFSKPTEPKEKN